ncbi:MAG: hypothetical protein VZR36_11840 [Prevotella sp.]|nr:hypothetical protein [Prevotella sp.]
MAIKRHLQHIRSSVPESVPTAEQLTYGEIAVNYSTDKERLFIKNANNDIIPFYSGKVIEENEQVTAAALADIDSRIDGIEENSVNLENMESVTYSELRSKRDNGELVPGKHYRITDYVTTTAQENTQSAGHQFDVVVLALGESTLSENAHAMLHDDDTYFSGNGADLSAWELKYCLDNSAHKFEWADSINGKGVIYYMKDEWNNECPYDFKNIQFKRWAVTDIQNDQLSLNTLTDLKQTFMYNEQSGNFTTRYAYQDANIQNGNTTFIVDANDYDWYYTFSTIKQENGIFDFSNIEDASIKGNSFRINGIAVGCFGNIIKPYYENMSIGPDGVYGYQYLSNNVFNGYYYRTFGNREAHHACRNSIGYNSSFNTFGYNVSFNSFGQNFQNNTFGSNCMSNTFTADCSFNTFGDQCNVNAFETGCNTNMFGDACIGNKFKNGCSLNNFGLDFRLNIFGNGCTDNTFGDHCTSNTFGDSCSSNIFGEYCTNNLFGISFQNNTFDSNCSSNIFGNECSNNTVGSRCQANTFGNRCSSNTLATYCDSNTFGDSVIWITFSKDFTLNVIVENGNHNITLTSTVTTSKFSHLCNITIAQGVNNTMTNKTISHDSVNDMFKTTYQPVNSVIVSV